MTYSANGTNAAKNTIATFTQAGTYIFTATIMNPAIGSIVTSSVTVTVKQVAAGASIVPISTSMAAGATAQFVAGTADQFGHLMGSPSAVTWSVASGGGNISSSGVYTAPITAGSATIRATFSGGGVSDATIMIDAPIAWYQANSSSGTTLADSSGNGNDGTLTGAATFAPGVSGNALSLAGGNATLPTGIVSNLTDFTIAAWVNVSTLANWDRIFDFGTGTSNYMFLTPDAGDTNRIRFAITSGSGPEQQLDGPPLVPGSWTHIAVTLTGTTATLYVNGVTVATDTSMTLDPSSLGITNQNYLGKSQFGADPALQGSIDDFRIYNTALSAQQILQLADPAVISPAAATNPVTTTSTALNVLASDVTAGESALNYTWSTVGTPPAPVSFSVNGTNAAKNTVATFTQPGTYNFQVAIDNPAVGATFTTTSSITVTVNQTLTTITITPSTADLHINDTQQFSAAALDQFGTALASQPVFVWSLAGGSAGTLSSSGLYTAPESSGSATVQATSGVVNGSASVSVTYLTGDINFDGHLDVRDVFAFMQASVDWNTYEDNHNFSPQNLPAVADINGDGQVTNADLQALLIVLRSGVGSGGGSLSTGDAASTPSGTSPVAAAGQSSNDTPVSNPSGKSIFPDAANEQVSKEDNSTGVSTPETTVDSVPVSELTKSDMNAVTPGTVVFVDSSPVATDDSYQMIPNLQPDRKKSHYTSDAAIEPVVNFNLSPGSVTLSSDAAFSVFTSTIASNNSSNATKLCNTVGLRPRENELLPLIRHWNNLIWQDSSLRWNSKLRIKATAQSGTEEIIGDSVFEEFAFWRGYFAN